MDDSMLEMAYEDRTYVPDDDGPFDPPDEELSPDEEELQRELERGDMLQEIQNDDRAISWTTST